MHDAKDYEGGEARLPTPAGIPPGSQAREMLHSENLLVRELTHRMANDWTSAISTISNTARASNSPAVKLVLNDLSRRLVRRAELMRALQIPDGETPLDAASYLGRVCLAIDRSRLEDQNIRLAFTAEPLPMTANNCLRLGMIVCELLTNSARHAFRDRNGGTIHVCLSRSGGLAECRVTDDGSAPKNTRPGHGLAIARELIGSLGGSIQQTFGESGSTSILRFPVA